MYTDPALEQSPTPFPATQLDGEWAGESAIHRELAFELLMKPYSEELDLTCAPFPYPLEDRRFMELAPGQQVPLYPANAGTDYGAMIPFVAPSRSLHEILKVR